jgi:hypothetical protein
MGCSNSEAARRRSSWRGGIAFIAFLVLCGLALATGARAGTPAVTLSASSLTFEPQYPTYYTSPPQSVTLTNSGTGPLVISSISLGGANPGDFTLPPP